MEWWSAGVREVPPVRPNTPSVYSVLSVVEIRPARRFREENTRHQKSMASMKSMVPKTKKGDLRKDRPCSFFNFPVRRQNRLDFRDKPLLQDGFAEGAVHQPLCVGTPAGDRAL